MRAIIIDPFIRRVFDVALQPDERGSTLRSLYATLGCTTIDIVRVGEDRRGQRLDLCVDDDGRLKPAQACFRMGELLIAGRAVLTSVDAEGETVRTEMTLEDAERPILWCAPGTDYTPEPTRIQEFDTLDDMFKAMSGTATSPDT